MAKPKFTVDEIAEHYDGVCKDCGNVQGGVEPDAERYTCELCGEETVYGLEQAFLLGYIDIEE